MCRSMSRACVCRSTLHTCAALALGAGLCAPAFAQRFQRYIGMPSDERPANLERTSDDGFVITGRRDAGAATGQFTAFITRTDANGIVQWTTDLKDPLGAGTDVAGIAARQDSAGGYIMGARRAAGLLSLGLSRFDPLGNLLWANAYTAEPVDGRLAVRQVGAAGDFVAVTQGREPQFPAVFPAGVFVRTGPAGNLTAFARYTNVTFTPAPGSVWLSDFRPVGTAGAGFYVCGGVDVNTPGPAGVITTPAMLVMNVAPNGAVVWAFAYSASAPSGATPRTQGLTGLDVAANGEIVVTGYTVDPANNNEHINVMRLTPGGAPLWLRQYREFNMAGGFTSKNIREAPDGNLVIGTNHNLVGVAAGRMTILRTDALGFPLGATAYTPFTGADPATNAVLAGPNLDRPAIAGWKIPPAGTPVGMGPRDIVLVRADAAQQTPCYLTPIPAQPLSPTPQQIQLGMFVSTTGDFTPWAVLPARPFFGQTSLCCPGDITGDNRVDFTDLNAVLSAFGTTYTFPNLNTVLGNFGVICPP